MANTIRIINIRGVAQQAALAIPRNLNSPLFIKNFRLVVGILV